MSITECFSMRKRRSVDKTPGRSSYEVAGKLRRTPRRIAVNSNSSFHDQSLEIIWDNNSPSPGRTLSLGKRKKKHESDSSSSGGEISDLVQKLADKSGLTPEANPPLLAFWMAREDKTLQKIKNNSMEDKSKTDVKQKGREFQTPSRRPRRVLRKYNKTKIKLLKQEIEELAHRIEEPDEIKEPSKRISTEVSKRIDSCTTSEKILRSKTEDTQAVTKTKSPKNSKAEIEELDTSNFFDEWHEGSDDDLILSQVDIATLCNGAIEKTQIITNTQFLDSGDDANENSATPLFPSPKCCATSNSNVNEQEWIVTESWDFADNFSDSDDEGLLQSALEDYERSQHVTIPTVQRLSHLTPMFPIRDRPCNNQQTVGKNLEKNQGTSTILLGKNSSFPRPIVPINSLEKKDFSFVPRSSLQDSTVIRNENVPKENSVSARSEGMLSVNRTESQRNTCTLNWAKEGKNVQQPTALKDKAGDTSRNSLKTKEQDSLPVRQTKYSKQDIERKRMEAHKRRKQRMLLSQQKCG